MCFEVIVEINDLVVPVFLTVLISVMSVGGSDNRTLSHNIVEVGSRVLEYWSATIAGLARRSSYERFCRIARHDFLFFRALIDFQHLIVTHLSGPRPGQGDKFAWLRKPVSYNVVRDGGGGPASPDDWEPRFATDRLTVDETVAKSAISHVTHGCMPGFIRSDLGTHRRTMSGRQNV